MALTTLTRIKTFLAVSGNASDAVLTDLLNSASEFVKNWTGRDFEVTAYVIERRNGTGGQVLLTRQYPIVSIVAITVDGVAIPATAYVFDETAIYLTGYAFTRGVGNVVLSYSAGLSTIPDDLQQVVVDLVARKFKSRDWIGYRSKSLAGETVAFDASDVPADTKALLSNYKMVCPA